MIKVRIQLSYRLVPYEIEASDRTDIVYVLGEGFLAKAIDQIHDFIDGYYAKVEREAKANHCAVDDDLRVSGKLCV